MAEEDVVIGGKTFAADFATIEGEIKRVSRDKVGWGAPGSYQDVDDVDGARLPVDSPTLTALLGQLLTELTQKLEAGQEVELGPAARAALETVQIGNLPSDPPTQTTLAAVLAAVDGVEAALTALATEAKLEAIRALLAATLAVDVGTVDATIASLPLPTGASTEATVAAVLAAVGPATPANIPGASGLVTTSTGKLMGVTARETSGTATAFFRLRAGSVSGTILATVTLLAGESIRDWYGPSGITAAGGVYYELVSGAVAGGVQTR